jgi:hypothetical protein
MTGSNFMQGWVTFAGSLAIIALILTAFGLMLGIVNPPISQSVRQELTWRGVEEARFCAQCAYRPSNKSARFGRGSFESI